MTTNVQPIKSRIHPYLTHALYRRLEGHARRQNLTESAVVERALREHLDGVGDLTLLYQRLDRHTRAVEKLTGTVRLGIELLDAFLQLYLRNTPQLPEADLRANKVPARSRHDKILEHIRTALSSGRSVIDRLLTDDDNLELGSPSAPTIGASPQKLDSVHP